MDKIPSKVAGRQAEICLALIREIDQAVVNSRQPADQILTRIYRQHREYGARDRRFFSNAVFSWFRWRGWLKTPANENVAAAILLDAEEIPPQMEYIIEGTGLLREKIKPLGPLPLEQKAEYLQHLLNSPSLQINQVGRDSSPRRSLQTKPGLSRRLHRRRISLWPIFGRTGLCGPTFLKFPCLDLTPDWVSDALFIPANRKPEAHLRQCLEAFQTRPPTWLRLRWEQRKNTLSLLDQAGVEIETHPLIKQAAFIKGNRSFDSAQFPIIEIQDLASQCVGICCSPKTGEKWWDICAGSGGKSLHLADLIQDNGLILATDIRPAILKQLSARLKRNKYCSIKISPWDGVTDLPAVLPPQLRRCWRVQAGPAPKTYFDGVLVDAPCSGLGTWARNPDARWRTSAIQVRDYANIQKNLLQIAAGKVKPGGRLVYSTCTLTKAESMDIITAFLEQNREFQLEELINPLNHEPANGIIWIWPWEWNCNGMFIAVMKKD